MRQTMQFECSIEIDAPLEFVTEHFSNRENQKKWHDGLISITPLEGELGTVGSKCELDYGKFKIIETVTVSQLPHEYSGEFDTPKTCRNSMKNFFEPVGEGTNYRVEVEYTYMLWILRVMNLFKPNMMKNQVEDYLAKFKSVVESEFLATKPS